MAEVYISIDIEADGPCPGLNSMLSIGAAAYDATGKLLNEFYANLEPLPDAKADPDTMLWWAKQQAAWEQVIKDRQDPGAAMVRFTKWVEGFLAPVVPIAYPAGFDWPFVYYYLHRFTGRSVFGFQCVDIKTLAWSRLGGYYRRAIKKNFPDHWFGPTPHTHNALEDAKGQGELFFKILKEVREINSGLPKL